ncbi:hypothetical protein AWN76_006880 [Rhodothermaceae bacterium RA]|nr:hypothetical protein AWN76_006880 [Rhodothermaceae bacterium RA]
MEPTGRVPRARWTHLRALVRGLVEYAGLLEGGIAVALVLGTYALLQRTPDPALLLVAGCAVALVYLAERTLARAPEDGFTCPDRVAWLQGHRGLVVGVAGLLVAGCGLGLLALRPMTLGLGVVLGLAGAGYMLPVGPGRRRLKAHPWLKPATISGAWAVGAVMMPALEAGVALTGMLLWLVVYRWCLLLPNVLLADWADRAGDARAGLQTLATRYPLAALRQAAGLALGLAMAGGALAASVASDPVRWWVDLVGYGLMLGVVLGVPEGAGRRLGRLLDVLVAWPLVTALGAWGMGRL